MNTEIFKDTKSNSTFYENGFLKFGSIDSNLITKLIDLSKQLDIPDYNGCDYNCGMNSDIYELRKRMHDGLLNLLSKSITDLLVDFTAYSATFVNKNPNDNCFVHAHQDFTFSREPEIPSLMCWIPLVDVDINNGAMGFIPKSHTFFDHIRAFPFPFAKTNVTENEVRLMSYFEIVNMKAGEMVFFMNSTIHGSFGNYSNLTRYAITINFHKNNEQILAYIHNPKTNGKTILKFEVSRDFIVENNNLLIQKMFDNGSIDVGLPAVEEISYVTEEISWKNIENKLISSNLKPNKKYEELIKKYLAYQRTTKLQNSFYNLFMNIKHKFFK